jgi:hypothetical protein
MHVHVPEKYRSPFLHGVFLFSKVEVLVVNFDDFFALAYSSYILWSWPLGKIWCYHTSLSSTLDLKSCQFCPIILRKGIMEPALPCIFRLPPSLIMPPSVQFGFGDEAMWRKVWQRVVFMQNFWNSKTIPDTEIILTLIQSKLILKKFKWFLWRGFQMWWKLFFCFAFDENMKNMKWHLVGHERF